MSATTCRILTSIQGDGDYIQVDYWDGYGKWPGYVTSFSQYRAYLRDHLLDCDCSLYFINEIGRSEIISNDAELRKAVESLCEGGTLLVTAVIHNMNDDRSEQSSEPDENESHISGHDLFVETKPRRVSAIMERFRVYDAEEQCYHCKTRDWYGVRYSFTSNSDYFLCPSCFRDLPKSQKRDWQLTACINWEEDVPAYPLSEDDDGDEVRQLQYILTRIGMMPLSATDHLVGSYRRKTKEAVRKFRERYRTFGDDMTEYNQRMAAKLAQVVRRLREEGHVYI